MKTKTNKLVRIFLTMLMCFTFALSSVSLVFADPSTPSIGSGGSSGLSESEQALASLSSKVQGKMSSNTYSVDGGGSLSGSDIFEKDQNREGGFTINGNNFSKLDNKGQNQFISDLADECDTVVSDSENESATGGASNRTPDITDETVTNWWKELQSVEGVGSRFLNEILKNTKPDFVTANQMYAPMSKYVSIALGFICVVVMGLIGIVMGCDIAYITLPPVRLLVSERSDSGGGKNKVDSSKIFTHDAIYAVECAENERDGGSGGGKQALGIYLKRRILALVLLGICLLYLIHGQIYTFVGMILDALNGFLGF